MANDPRFDDSEDEEDFNPAPADISDEEGDDPDERPRKISRRDSPGRDDDDGDGSSPAPMRRRDEDDEKDEEEQEDNEEEEDEDDDEEDDGQQVRDLRNAPMPPLLTP